MRLHTTFASAIKPLLATVLFLFSTSQKIIAQEQNLVYLSSELNLGNYIGLSGDINYILNETYTFKFGIVGNIRKPVNQPDDYNAGIIGVLSYGLVKARDHMQSVNIAVGKLYKLNQSGTLRLNAAAGIGFTNIQSTENWQKIDDATIGTNYTYDVVEKNTVSLIINPKIEIPLGRVFGFTISPMAIINAESSYYGLGFGSMIGKISPKLK